MKNHWLALGMVVGMMLGGVCQAQAGLIAYWRFESGAFTVDSSGNGNALTNNHATQSTDTPPHVGGSGSAYFDGTGTSAFMQTSGNLNLSPYKNIAISWWQKVDTTNTVLVWEHSANYNSYDGGLNCTVNESGYTPAYVCLRKATSPAGYTMDTFPYTSNTWEHITAVINLGLPSGNTHEVVKVYRNGVLVSSDKLTTLNIPSALRNDVLYLGARSGATSGLFKGWLDEMKIETVSDYVNLVANKTGLVGYWRLGEGSGTTAWEVLGLTGNGTYVNVASGDYAKPGAIRFDPDTAVRFNGTNSYVNAGNDPDLNGNWSGLTVAAWVYPDALNGVRLIAGKWAQTIAHDHFGLFLSNGKLLFAVANGAQAENGFSSTSSLVANQWQFVVGTWDATTNQYSLYINGVLDSTGTRSATGLNTSSGAPLGIGAQISNTGSVSRYFSGLIDEVAIYNRALSAQEIFQLYALATVPEPSTWALAGLGLMSLIALALRRRRTPVT
ncbi:MAG TPA: sialidase domain-containing protein [Thermoguttaceae bacterium]|nr:sialidase domain-containing protein [Thermoguttaceae bacterium]HPP52156.1 sialidase domain-containing protein [Thermoguttaceae bacterium]